MCILRWTERSRGKGAHVLLDVSQHHEHLLTAVLLRLISDARLNSIQTAGNLRARANNIADVQLDGSQSLVDRLPKLCDLTGARFDRQVWRRIDPNPLHLWFQRPGHWYSNKSENKN